MKQHTVDTLKRKRITYNLLEAIKKLLLKGSAGTQEEICSALKDQGFDVNQSKISRILRKIGATKVLTDRQVVYSLPREPAPPSTHSPLAQLIISVAANEVMIVVRTNPGSASLIARLVDHHQNELNVLGSVAGDDTLFIVPKSIKQIKTTLESIKKILSNLAPQ